MWTLVLPETYCFQPPGFALLLFRSFMVFIKSIVQTSNKVAAVRGSDIILFLSLLGSLYNEVDYNIRNRDRNYFNLIYIL